MTTGSAARRVAVPRAVPITLALLLSLGALPMAAGESRDASDPVVVPALAVAQDATGTFVGVAATIQAQVLSAGSGQVYVATKPLAQEDMQGSARLASRVAAATLGVDWGRYDYLVSFTSQSTVIGGPSAGAVMTLALTVALHNLDHPDDPWRIDRGVAATGTINPDGTIGPVGGIPAKAQGARDAGMDLFLYPAGLDVATTQVQGRTVAVDMQEHCRGLGIRCRAAATLADLALAGAGLQLALPDEDLPTTTDYAEQLRPSVAAQVDALADRVERARRDPDLAGLSAAERQGVQPALDEAAARADEAQQALDVQRYYLAATRSFQGAIAAGRAENVTEFFARDRARSVLDQAVATCHEASAEADAGVAGLRSEGLNELYAIGSAQQRARQASELAAQAAAQAQTQFVDEAVAALGTAAFCDERAGTVAWWAGLRDAFGPGPQPADLAALARDTVDEARDFVAYAAAVLGAVPDAQGHLDDAQDHLGAGRLDAAVVAAVEAQTAASVAMQTGAGAGGMPAEVLAAAQQAAARAIAAAREAGIEPLLSVSLVELSQDQGDPALALSNLWTARSLALLGRSQPAADARFVGGLGADDDPRREAWVNQAGAAALMLVGAAVLVLALVALARRR